MVFQHLLGRKQAAPKLRHFASLYAPASITDPGCEREVNEDRVLVIESPVGTACFVFDGMGGEPGGEAAAQTSQQVIRQFFMQSSPTDDPEAVLREALRKAHTSILIRQGNPQCSSMGTTVVAAVLRGNEVFIASLGDSRAYVMHSDYSRQITVDDSLVQQLIDQGKLDEGDAMVHPQAHVLTRCLGASGEFELHVDRYWIWSADDQDDNDTLLLCSDGLYDLVDEEEMRRIVTAGAPAKAACIQLVDTAKQLGGYDNISAIIMPLEGVLKSESPTGAAAADTDLSHDGLSMVSKIAMQRGVKQPFSRRRSSLVIGISAVACAGAVIAGLLVWLG